MKEECQISQMLCMNNRAECESAGMQMNFVIQKLQAALPKYQLNLEIEAWALVTKIRVRVSSERLTPNKCAGPFFRLLIAVRLECLTMGTTICD